jgi:hypothetical protein
MDRPPLFHSDSFESAMAKTKAEWLLLNDALDEADRTVLWFDKLRNSEDSTLLEQFADQIYPALYAQQRWADIGILYSDPLGLLRKYFERLEEDKAFAASYDASNEELPAMVDRVFRSKIATLARALLAAGRGAEAQQVTARALELDGSRAVPRPPSAFYTPIVDGLR